MDAPTAPLSSVFILHPSSFILSITSLGVSAFVTQIVMLRELLTAFAGNELVLGIVLGSWFLLTGVGAALGRTAQRLTRPLSAMAATQIVVALAPLVAVFALRTLRNVVFVRGAAVGVSETVLGSLVLLGPYCLVLGYLLTLACHVLAAARGPAAIGRVYFLDNLGEILGGVAFSFVLVYWCDHFQALGLVAVLNLAAVAWLASAARLRGWAVAALLLLASVIGLVGWGDLEGRSTRLEYRPQEVVFHGDSPYARLVVTRADQQFTFFGNGQPLFSTQNVEQVEETVHYALAQRDSVRRVLLISGGIAGTAREILKYPQAEVDYVELDPLAIDAAQRFLPAMLADPRIHVERTDGRRFVRTTPRRYDAVIVDAGPPSTSQANRFYTREFLAELRHVLVPGGVMSLSLGEYGDYIGPELARILAVSQRTAAGVFRHTLLVPGYCVYLLASDEPLRRDVAARLEAAQIPTRFVNRNYLQGALTPARFAQLERLTDPAAPENRDFSPILYYYHLRYWLQQFEFRWGVLEALLLGGMVLYVLCIRPVTAVLFTAGLAASVLEVVLLLAFQILYGSVYHQVGLIITMFMLGLAIGSGLMNRWLEKRCQEPFLQKRFLTPFSRRLAGLSVGMAGLAIALPPILMGIGRIDAPILGQATIALLSLMLAVLVGMIFPLAGKVDFHSPGTTAGRLFAADYLGSALGALLISTWLIPLVGVVAVCGLTAGLCLISALVLRMASRGSA